MSKWNKILVSLGIVGTITVAGVAVVDLDPKTEEAVEDTVQKCTAEEVSINTKHEFFTIGTLTVPYVSERLCMSQEIYTGVKQSLVAEYEDHVTLVEYYEVNKDGLLEKKLKPKYYDFNVNNKDLLIAILAKEALLQDKEEVLISDDAELIIDLLK